MDHPSATRPRWSQPSLLPVPLLIGRLQVILDGPCGTANVSVTILDGTSNEDLLIEVTPFVPLDQWQDELSLKRATLSDYVRQHLSPF